jgi:hypothetical protein
MDPSNPQQQQGMMQPPQQPSQPLPTSRDKETPPPQDVADARKRRSDVLKERQKVEVSGQLKGPNRDIDPGYGFGPPLIPYLF